MLFLRYYISPVSIPAFPLRELISEDEESHANWRQGKKN